MSIRGLIKKDSFSAPHLDKTDLNFKSSVNPATDHHYNKKYRLMLDPFTHHSKNVLKYKNKKYKQECCELEF